MTHYSEGVLNVTKFIFFQSTYPHLFFEKSKFRQHFQNEDIYKWKIYIRRSESPAGLPRASEAYIFIFKTVCSDILIKEKLLFSEEFDEMFLRNIGKMLQEVYSNPSFWIEVVLCRVRLLWLSFNFPATKQGKHSAPSNVLDLREIKKKKENWDRTLGLRNAIL